MANNKKSEAFIRLAEARTLKALKAIDNIGNLSNTNNYEYNSKQIKSICDALKSAVLDIEQDFKKKEKKVRNFHL